MQSTGGPTGDLCLQPLEWAGDSFTSWESDAILFDKMSSIVGVISDVPVPKKWVNCQATSERAF